MKKYLYVLPYLASIPLANWMISHVGTQSFPNGPHTIPVGFGFQAPSGVLMIGIALFARDLIQEKTSKLTTLVAIGVGILISYFVNKDVAVASAVAFAFGELCDFAIYSKIRQRHLPLAVAISGIVGGIIDSLLFLQIAFGSTQFWEGQVIGKTFIACLCAMLIVGWRDISQRLSAVQS